MKNVNVIVKRIKWDDIEKNFDNLLKKLHPARYEAVKRYKNRKAAIVSMVAGLLLQEIVEKELGITPNKLDIEREENGKPKVKGYPGFHYNISHSGDMVVVAYGKVQLGVDIEHVRYHSGDLKMAKRCFTASEYDFIIDEKNNIDIDGNSYSQEERFFMIWTMKEAYLKYTGDGIIVPMNSFEVKAYEGVIDDKRLKAKPLIYDGYALTVCVDEDVEVIYNMV